MTMPTRTFPRAASVALRGRPSSEETGAFRAINRAPETRASDEPGEGRIPTQPFGTRAVVISPAAPLGSRRGRDSGVGFRFLLPTLPTSPRPESKQRTSDLTSQSVHSGSAAPRDPVEPPARILLPILLGASALAILAFLVLLWPDDWRAPERATPPRSPPSAVPSAPQGSPESATAQTHNGRGTRIAESPKVSGAQVGAPAIRPPSSPQPRNGSSPAPSVATHPASQTSPRATVREAQTPLDGERVLASVLAPPPAE